MIYRWRALLTTCRFRPIDRHQQLYPFVFYAKRKTAMKVILSHWGKIAGTAVLTLLLISFTTIYAQNVDTQFAQLVITQFPEQNVLAKYPLNDNDSFSLSFIHSVSYTRVVDVYEVRNGSIVQTSEIFETHGAGLPSNAEEPGGLSWEKTKDGFILHMERQIPKLVVRTDSSYRNRLHLPSGEVNLNQWENQALFLHVVPTPQNQ